MGLGFKKFLFYLVWLVALSLGPITIIRNSSGLEIFGDEKLLINFLQRLTGLLAFTLITFQIILGSQMTKLIEKLGGWIFSFHVTEGLFVLGIVLLHPLLFTLLNYLSGGLSAALLTILPRFNPNQEIWYSFGKFGLLLILTAIFAGYFRQRPFLRKNWRKFHILNYFAFILVAIHAYFSGSDAWTAPFSWFYWLAIGVVLFLILLRLNVFRKNLLVSRSSSSTPAKVV
jgi:predicted ferric reductase